MKPSYRRRALLAAALGLAGWSAGCSPEFNWREVRYPEQGLRVMFPGKPATISRRIQLDGEEVEMTMHGTAAGGLAFAAGVVPLPDPGRRDKYLAAMRAQMARNIAGRETGVETVEVPVLDAQGARRGQVPATLVRIDGLVGKEPTQMVAVFVGHGDGAGGAGSSGGGGSAGASASAAVARVMQFVVVGPAARMNNDETGVFVGSIRLLQ